MKGINNFFKRDIYGKLRTFDLYPNHYQGRVYKSFIFKIV